MAAVAPSAVAVAEAAAIGEAAVVEGGGGGGSSDRSRSTYALPPAGALWQNAASCSMWCFSEVHTTGREWWRPEIYPTDALLKSASTCHFLKSNAPQLLQSCLRTRRRSDLRLVMPLRQ